MLNGFSPLQTNGGYCSMHLNNDIVNVLNNVVRFEFELFFFAGKSTVEAVLD